MARKSKEPTTLLEVLIHEAKPNKMFPDWMTQRVRFLTYSRAIECKACGKRSKFMWTMTCAFTAHSFGTFTVLEGSSFEPLQPVCQDHPMAPDFPEAMKKEMEAAREAEKESKESG